MKALILAAATLAAIPALADESKFQLKDAPGKDKAAAYCAVCHSTDYIQLNSPFLDRKGWEASVTKMIKVMGAPIKPEDVNEIVDYLANNYGK